MFYFLYLFMAFCFIILKLILVCTVWFLGLVFALLGMLLDAIEKQGGLRKVVLYFYWKTYAWVGNYIIAPLAYGWGVVVGRTYLFLGKEEVLYRKYNIM